MPPALERAARALCRHEGQPEDRLVEGAPLWQSYVDKAREVLKAIRDPDEVMAEAGSEIIRAAVDGQNADARQRDAATLWRYMIDVALGG